jgi:glucose-6-phosphate isomerase
MNLAEPATCSISMLAGTMTGSTGRYAKRLSDLRGIYADDAALTALIQTTGDPVVYDVCDFRPSADPGDLIFGVTRMSPGKVAREFFLTRGHVHAKANRPEVYYGQKGFGVMQLESPDGETRIVEIGPQTICYVPPFWIHRSVNTGMDDLLMMFSYPADSGQDYGIIERSRGMRHRVVSDGAEGWTLVENPDYVARAPSEIAKLFERTD